ncbi:unnamed protein product, partial [Gulo gulo]
LGVLRGPSATASFLLGSGERTCSLWQLGDPEGICPPAQPPREIQPCVCGQHDLPASGTFCAVSAAVPPPLPGPAPTTSTCPHVPLSRTIKKWLKCCLS